MELSQEHIANLKVVLNRERMLELLPSGGVVAEMGVDSGDFSQKILDITRPRHLHLIDVWGTPRYGEPKFDHVQTRFRPEVEKGRVSIHRGPSVEMLATFPDGSLDWAYIDTTHAYELTCQELALSQRKVRRGGIIAGHDYTPGNVRKALAYGVVQAVHEFCVRENWEMLYLTHESDRYLSFALREIAA
jgi:hypothetical protein